MAPVQKKEGQIALLELTGFAKHLSGCVISPLTETSLTGKKRIAVIGNPKGSTLPKEERTMRLNVMRHFAAQLQGLGKDFRVCQKDFLHRLKGQDEVSSEFFTDEKTSSPVGLEEALDRGLTTDQVLQLQQLEQKASERDREILHIAQSINDLAQIFRELNVLVIEQGTVLDRIDYHVEQALIKVKEGTIELKKADEHSKKARTLKCIVALILINIILGITVYYVKKDKK